jgi:MtN3 and saliva related transmembrane protein
MASTFITGLGIAGNFVVVASYFPQIQKIIVTKKSEDISLPMWALYVLGDLMLLIYSIATNDTIFTMLFILFTIENIVVLYLAFKYAKVNRS